MKCPHCLFEIHPNTRLFELGMDKTGKWDIIRYECPNPSCGKFSFSFTWQQGQHQNGAARLTLIQNYKEWLVYPKMMSRNVPPEVPDEFREDFEEACLVLSDSPKASSALSRRCLQNLLRDKAGVKPGSLASEIQEVLNQGMLPSHLAENIDAIRNIGNFSAHPIKSDSSGEIVPVETNEAEWNIDVLESLFDFYFVQPAISQRKRDELNQKLQDTGKEPMKQEES